VGLSVGKLDEYVEYDPPLKAKYGGNFYLLYRYYPEANVYAYRGPSAAGYGFVRDSAVEIMENSDE